MVLGTSIATTSALRFNFVMGLRIPCLSRVDMECVGEVGGWEMNGAGGGDVEIGEEWEAICGEDAAALGAGSGGSAEEGVVGEWGEEGTLVVGWMGLSSIVRERGAHSSNKSEMEWVGWELCIVAKGYTCSTK